MTTQRAIVNALSTASNAGDSVVLATVVRVTGSSYGGVGARMVVRVDGSTVGLVSGGCLESDLAEHARKVHEEGKAKVVTYDTRADDDAAWGLGLGCNGLIDVLLEPLNANQSREIGELLRQALDNDAPSVLATVMNVESGKPGMQAVGAHALITSNSINTSGDWGSGEILDLIKSQREDALAAGRRGLVSEFGEVQVAFEVVNPAVRLVICGSGPDVVPLVNFATQLGWEVIVVDHRPVVHAPVERFPGATVVECADSLRLGDSVTLTSQTAAVVMSHHYARDLEYVSSLLNSGVAYIGILGPRARTERMFSDIAAAGEDADPQGRDTVFGPIGLDVGGDGPGAIALAIVSEVSAVTYGREGGHLRDSTTSLHEPSARTSDARAS